MTAQQCPKSMNKYSFNVLERCHSVFIVDPEHTYLEKFGTKCGISYG